MADRSCRHPDGRPGAPGASWAEAPPRTAASSSPDEALARGVSPPSRRDKSDQSDPHGVVTLTGAMSQLNSVTPKWTLGGGRSGHAVQPTREEHGRAGCPRNNDRHHGRPPGRPESRRRRPCRRHDRRPQRDSNYCALGVSMSLTASEVPSPRSSIRPRNCFDQYVSTEDLDQPDASIKSCLVNGSRVAIRSEKNR